MTTAEKIEAIRQECIRHNKEITELKFGCEIKNKVGTRYTILCRPFEGWEKYGPHAQNDCPYFDKWIRANQNNQDDLDISQYDATRTTFTEKQLKEVDEWKIIGRKITLPDVLLAMKKSKKVASRQVVSKGWIGSVSLELFADDNEELAEISINEAYQGKWNLLKPLEEQEEPTISFIHDLLK